MKCTLSFIWLGLMAVAFASAQEDGVEMPEAESPEAAAAAAADEKVIPEAYSEARYQNSWKVNPFLKVTIDSVVQTQVDWANDWALAGMYKSTTGKITISLQNKQTQEFKRVNSDGSGETEFKFISANFNRNRDEASVEIEKDGKKATLKYDSALTARPVTVNNTFQAPGGQQPGAAGAVAAQGQQPQQGRPGQPVNVTPANPAIRPGPAASGGGRPQVTPVAPGANAGTAPAPPTISRRRQLIPSPPPSVQPAQQQ